ncbi:MAG: DUF2934 domain-containing protein [Gammaproteobacteria bacterium]
MSKKDTEQKAKSKPAKKKVNAKVAKPGKVDAKKNVGKKAVTKKAVKKKTAGKKSATKGSVTKTKNTGASKISADEKRMLIAMHAYYKWEESGRPDNADTHYWLEAESEINSMFK